MKIGWQEYLIIKKYENNNFIPIYEVYNWKNVKANQEFLVLIY